MTAQEAKNLLKINENSEEIKNFYKSVENNIRIAKHFNRGFNMTYSCNLLSKLGAEYLKTKGYTIKLVSDWRDGDYYDITL